MGRTFTVHSICNEHGIPYGTLRRVLERGKVPGVPVPPTVKGEWSLYSETEAEKIRDYMLPRLRRKK